MVCNGDRLRVQSYARQCYTLNNQLNMDRRPPRFTAGLGGHRSPAVAHRLKADLHTLDRGCSRPPISDSYKCGRAASPCRNVPRRIDPSTGTLAGTYVSKPTHSAMRRGKSGRARHLNPVTSPVRTELLHLTHSFYLPGNNPSLRVDHGWSELAPPRWRTNAALRATTDAPSSRCAIQFSRSRSSLKQLIHVTGHI